MMLWDKAWFELLRNQGIETLLYYRYVDDARNMLYALAEGWRWCEDEFVFTEGWRQEDLNSGVCDAARTTRELVKAMNSLVSFLQFEGEDASMFSSKKLPTLDTQLWVDQTGRQIRFEFYFLLCV